MKNEIAGVRTIQGIKREMRYRPVIDILLHLWNITCAFDGNTTTVIENA